MLAQMRRANIAKISLLIFIIEPSIWRLRNGSKEILHRCFRALPGARRVGLYWQGAPCAPSAPAPLLQRRHSAAPRGHYP